MHMKGKKAGGSSRRGLNRAIEGKPCVRLAKRIASAVLAAVLAVGLVPAAAFAEIADDASAQQASDGAALQGSGYRGFSDVAGAEWFVAESWLDYAVDHGLMNGYTDGTDRFDPDGKLLRGQVATVLWRIVGSPVADAEDFSDVDYGQYYGKAIEWARATGVITGFADNEFRPETPISRQDLALMLSRFAKGEGVDVSTDCAAMGAFADAADVGSWAREGLGWAVDAGLISGDLGLGYPRLLPTDPTTRAAFAKMSTVLHRDVLGLGGDSPVDPDPLEGVEYADDVEAIDAPAASVVDGDGTAAATVPAAAAAGVARGDIVVVNGDDLENGIAIDVESVTRNADGTATLNGYEPLPTEVFETLQIEGVETITPDDIELAPGVELVDEASLLDSGEFDPGKLKLSIKGGDNIEGAITFTLDPVVRYTVDIDWFKVKEVSVELEMSASISGKCELTVGDPIKLFEVKGLAGLTVYAVVNASGGITIDYNLGSVTVGAEYTERGGFDTIYETDDSEAGGTLSASLSGSLGVDVQARIKALGMMVADAGAKTGVSGEYGVTPHPDLVCSDLEAWWFVSVYVGRDSKLLETLKAKFSADILTKSNSPLHFEQHYEDGVEVPECTWGKSEESEPCAASDFTYAEGWFIETDGTVHNPGTSLYWYAKENGWTVSNGLPATEFVVTKPNGTMTGYNCGHGIYITGYHGESNHIVVPYEIDGLPVVYIDLENEGNMKDPDNVTIDLSAPESVWFVRIDNMGTVTEFVEGDLWHVRNLQLSDTTFDCYASFTSMGFLDKLTVHNVVGDRIDYPYHIEPEIV